MEHLVDANKVAAADPSPARTYGAQSHVVALLAAVLLIAWLIQPTLKIPQEHFLPIHIIAEIFAVVVSAMVFGVGWNSHGERQAGNIVVISCAFLAVALLDLGHMLSYTGMPRFVTPSGGGKGIDFWLVARFIDGGALLFAAATAWRPLKWAGSRRLLLAVTLAFTGVVYWLILARFDWLPATFIVGKGLTPLKVVCEDLIIGLHVVTAVLLWRRLDERATFDAGNLLAGTAIMAMGEAYFTLYTSTVDIYSLLGHLYKVIAYAFIYRSVFVDSVRRPHEELRASREREKEAMAAALKASETRFREIADTLPNILYARNRRGEFDYLNCRFSDYTGLPVSLGLSRTWVELVHPDDVQALQQAEAQAEASAQPFAIKCRLRGREGEYRWFLISSRPITEDSGEVVNWFGTATDVQDMVDRETLLADSESQFRAFFDLASVGLAHASLQGKFLRVNDKFCEITGYTREELLQMSIVDVTHPDDVAGDRDLFAAYARGDLPAYVRDKRYLCKDGSVRWVIVNARMITNADGTPRYSIGAIHDISERKHNEEQLRFAAQALDNAAEGVVITRYGQIVSVNRAFSAITGYAPHEVLGRSVHLLHSDSYDRSHSAGRREAIASTGAWQGEILGRRKNGEIYPAWASISAVDDEREGRCYVSVFSDITQEKAAEARMEYLAHHDVLTGLPNRALMQQRLGEALVRAQRNSHIVAVLYIDLDHFKPVNDSLGHQAGDELLQTVAHRLVGCVRQTDLVARLGGDEFVVLVDELQGVEEVSWIAQNIVNTLGEAFQLANEQVYISASVGIACFPHDAKTGETLLRHADSALYQAKEEGKNHYRFFSRGMDKNAHERLFLTTGLRNALERSELALAYQPRLSTEMGRMAGVEALVRWHSPEHGLILPSRFIGLAEETGIIEPIGEWVLRTACAQLVRWKAAGVGPQFVSVNLSARQFRQPKLAERVASILSEAGCDPRWLELEITESVVMANPEKARKILAQLAALGVRLSLDDFGTGHSSLAYLQRFPVHHLKVDQSFVRHVPDNRESANIIRAIVAMARSLELGVTAEGVETEAQRQFLADIGCDAWQGFLFSEPVDAAGLELFFGEPAAVD